MQIVGCFGGLSVVWRKNVNARYEVYCSECGNGKSFTWDESLLENYRKSPQHQYCSFCGTDMRGGNNG